MAAHRCRSWGRRGACVLLEMCQSSHRTGKEKAPGFSLPPTFQSPAPDSPLAKPTPEGRCSGSLRSCLLQGQCRAEQRAGMGSAKGRAAIPQNEGGQPCVRPGRAVVSDPCSPRHCSPPGSSVRGILQAGILQWASISFLVKQVW